MTIKDGHEPKFISKEDNNGKRGAVLTFVGERQKKGKWKSKFTSEALQSWYMFSFSDLYVTSFHIITAMINNEQKCTDQKLDQ